MERTKNDRLNELEIYRNYLFALQEREEYGDKYGDTDELMEIYKNKLKKILKMDTNGHF